MKPGRELDALVAERVMGLQLDKCTEKEWRAYRRTRPGYLRYSVPTNRCPMCGLSGIRPYSAYINVAWEVVEKLNKDYVFHLSHNFGIPRPWLASLSSGDAYARAEGETAPHAICLAALMAVGVDVDNK